MSSLEVPVSGPCVDWITTEEAAECCSAAGIGTDFDLMANAVSAASQLLFELSGRQFLGECTRTVRPCQPYCSCWGADWLVSPAQVPQVPLWSWGFWGSAGWGWGYESCGNVCGCGPLSRILLADFPVTDILSVKIDGAVLAATEYRLDEYKWLTRMAAADGSKQFWPSCQRLDLPSTESGTWEVTYSHGMSPPVLGQEAAKQLACQIYLQCASGGSSADCKIPEGTTKLTRQGIQIEKAPFVAWGLKDKNWATGLVNVDAFLSAYNPNRLRRRPSVWSPDVPRYPERIGD